MKVFITGGYHGLIQEVEETRTFEQCNWIIRKGGSHNPNVQVNVWECREDALAHVRNEAIININEVMIKMIEAEKQLNESFSI